MKRLSFSIANDFSKVPAGRYRSDGDASGQRFRDDCLLPLLEKRQIVEIDLDGAEGYGSSFLEEAFGGLVRAGYSVQDLNSFLILKSDEDPTLIDEINSYIRDAEFRAGGG